MIKNLIVAAYAVLMLASAGTAYADPPGETDNDAPNGQIVCDILTRNPSVSTMRMILVGSYGHFLEQEGTNAAKDDTIDAIAYGLVYICPEYQWTLKSLGA